MGQKINPIGFRVGRFIPWKSRWFAGTGTYQDLLLEDIKIRKMLMDKLKLAGIVNVDIERLPKSIVITLLVSRPGVVIGRGGSGIEEVKRSVVAIMKSVRKMDNKNVKVELKVQELKNPDLSAYLVATRIAGELERRMPHRRAITRAMERTIQSGAKGIKIVLAGRIAGADIARREKYHQGSVPTQTMREIIDYAQIAANGKRGYIGIKVWIYKPEK